MRKSWLCHRRFRTEPAGLDLRLRRRAGQRRCSKKSLLPTTMMRTRRVRDERLRRLDPDVADLVAPHQEQSRFELDCLKKSLAAENKSQN